MKRSLIWVAVALVVMTLAVVGWGLTGSRVSGSAVRSRDGKAIPAAIVKADGQGLAVSGGAFSTKLALGGHMVIVTAPGYESVSKPVKLSIFRRVDLGTIRLRNADLKVKAVENYPGYPGVKVAKFVIAGRTVDASAGEVTIADLPVGDATMTVTASGCEDASISVQLLPGENAITATITPTLESVVKRDAQNVIDRDLALSYAILHPARQKQWGTEADYTKAIEKRDKENEGMVSILGFKVLTPTIMPTYKDGPSGQTFKDVHKVPIAFRFSSPLLAMFGQKEMSMNVTNYWVRVDGQWRDLGDGERVQK